MRLFIISVLMTSHFSWGKKQYEQFDGRYYNNLYYPRVDLIEWGDPPRTYMVINVYQKKNIPVPIEMSFAFKADREGDSPKMLINYIIKNRNEVLCRHTVLPDHFKEGQYKVFVDRSNEELDKFFVTMDPEKISKKTHVQPFTPPAYQECKEEQENSQVDKGKTSSQPNMSPSNPKKTESQKPDESQSKKKEKDEDGGINSSVW